MMLFVLKVDLRSAFHTSTQTHGLCCVLFTLEGVTLLGTRVALPSYDEVRSDEAQLELSECSPVDLSRG
jgi:hypothetical protein